MKVAYYSPLPPDRSGIADYSALLLPALRRRVDVALARRGRGWRTRGAHLPLYHVGNDPERHGWIVEALRRRPGLVVLHDFVLHHLIAGMTLGRGEAEGYLAAMHQEAGPVGRMLAHGVIDGLVPPLWETRAEEFPLCDEVLEHASAVIVHSRFVEERVRERGYEAPVWRIPHPAWRPPDDLTDPGLPRAAAPLVGCFGNLTASKRIPKLLEAFARIRPRFEGAALLLVGAPAPGFELGVHLERLGLRLDEDVIHLDYVPEERLWALLSASDVCVSLRFPTMGETSGVAVRALALGTPLVVSDVCWFSELPDSVAAKIPVDESEVDTLAVVLERLCADATLRDRLGANGRAHARREHDVERVAEAYTEAIEETAGRSSVREAVLREVATAAAETGIGAESGEVAEIAGRLREVGI